MEENKTVGQYIRKYILDKYNMTQQDLSKKINVSRQTINQIIAGKIDLSPAMAHKLSKHYGETVDFWLGLKNQGQFYNGQSVFDCEDPVVSSWKKYGYHTLVDHELIDGINSGIFGRNFNIDCVQPASYDIRVGSQAEIINNGKYRKIDIEKEESIAIKPGEQVKISSYEYFEFPLFLLGRLGPMTDLQLNNINTLYGLQIDPGFKGVLGINLVNNSDEEYPLDYKMKFVSAEIYFLNVMPKKGYQKKKNNLDDIDNEHKLNSKDLEKISPNDKKEIKAMMKRLSEILGE